jgi:hypothetical protein
MATTSYIIPDKIRTKKGMLYFVREVAFIGNSSVAKEKIKSIRASQPNKRFRLHYNTISEYELLM